MRLPGEVERILIDRYGEYSVKELVDLAGACNPGYPIAYSGFITVSGRICGEIDDEHIEVFLHVLRRPDVDRISLTDYQRSGLIRLGAMNARVPEIYAEIYGVPNREQLFAMRELDRRGGREAILFRWAIRDGALHEGVGFAQLGKKLDGAYQRRLLAK